MSWYCIACGLEWGPFMVLFMVYFAALMVAAFADAPAEVYAGICFAYVLAALCVVGHEYAARRLAIANARADAVVDPYAQTYSSIN